MGILRVQLQCKSGFLATEGQIGGVSVFVKAELQEGSDTARSFLSLTKLQILLRSTFFGSFFKQGRYF